MTMWSRDAERRAFVYWMRTGRRLDPDRAPAVQHKFNPWHDPENGQFTSGGGTFGGAGANGSWDRASPRPAPKSGSKRPPAKPPQRSTELRRRLELAGALRGGHPNSTATTEHQRNGYRFLVDSHQRTLDISGRITLGQASPRSRLHQARAGGADRLPRDDGGHFIAHRFNGPSGAFNHFAQNAHFNRGAYRVIEDGWARSTRQGKAVFVHITPKYHGASRRPSALQIRWTIDGHTTERILPN